MEQMISLMIVVIALLGMLVPAAYAADALAGQLVKWLNSVAPNFEE